MLISIPRKHSVAQVVDYIIRKTFRVFHGCVYRKSSLHFVALLQYHGPCMFQKASAHSSGKRRPPEKTKKSAALRAEWFIIPLLIAVTLTVFWPVQGHGFLAYDDDAYVYDNPHVNTGLTITNIRWALTAMEAYNWHPLTWISHMVDVQFYGLNPAGHHRTNLLLHLANTVLLFLVLRRMTRSAWRSALVAALFAIHPLHVESVAWVAERKDVLSTFFMLLTIQAYLRYIEATPYAYVRGLRSIPLNLKAGMEGRSQKSEVGSRRPEVGGRKSEARISSAIRIRRYLPVVLLFSLGLMSKPMVISLPLLLLLLDYWPLGRMGTEGRSLWRLVYEKLPLMILAGASGIITFVAQQSEGAVMKLAGYPLGPRIANAIVSYARYIIKMIWPVGLVLPYPYPDSGYPIWQVAGAALLLVLATCAAVRLAAKSYYLAVGWFWFLLSLFPVIGLVQVGGQAMADRYTYTTMIGLFILIVWGAADLSARGTVAGTRTEAGISPVRAVSIALAVVVITALAVRARAQAACWRDGVTLFSRAVALTPENYLAHNHLGVAYDRAGEPDRAAEEYRKTLAIAPDYALAYYNLGRALTESNKVEEAIGEFRKAISLSPRFYRTHHNLGYALAKIGKLDEAMQSYREALRLAPQSGATHYNLAVLLYGKGYYADAWAEIRLAKQYSYPVNPDFLQALSAKMPDPGR